MLFLSTKNFLTDKNNPNTMSESISARVRGLREAAGISIEELASKVSIAASQVEMIEQGKVAPSIATLVRIARALGTRLGTILDGVECSGPAVTKCSEITPTVNVSSKGEASRGNLSFFSMAPNKFDRHMEPFVVEVEYHGDKTIEKSHHEGEEFLYVLEGEVEVQYGSDVFHLSKGDSIYYDSLVKHCVSSMKPGEKAKVLAVLYTPF